MRPGDVEESGRIGTSFVLVVQVLMNGPAGSGYILYSFDPKSNTPERESKC